MRTVQLEKPLFSNKLTNVNQSKHQAFSRCSTPFTTRHAKSQSTSKHHTILVHSQASDAVVVESTINSDAIAQSTPPQWTHFAQAVSGEWDGVTATFDRDGEPQELPSYYVPEAYRDWDVKIHDWQSQCSVLATDNTFSYTLRRLMPTVGCEADAIAFTEESAQQQGTIYDPTTMAYDNIGNYSFATANDISSNDVKKAQYEHCFVLQKGQRIRVVHTLKRMGADQLWKLMEIEVHREKYDCEYTGRRELAGCGGGMDLFAVSTPIDIRQEVLSKRKGEQLVWKEERGVRFSMNGEHQLIDSTTTTNNESSTVASLVSTALLDDTTTTTNESSAISLNVVGLPLKVFSMAHVDGNNNNAELIAGVVLNNSSSDGGDDDSRMRVSRQKVESGRVVERELVQLVV